MRWLVRITELMACFVTKTLEFFFISTCPVDPLQCTVGGRESRLQNQTSPVLAFMDSHSSALVNSDVYDLLAKGHTLAT